MKLEHVTVKNFGPIGSFDAELAPLTLLAAKNGKGKSTLLEGIDFAFTGNPGRAENKKNLHMRLHRGAASGMVSVEYDQGQIADRDVATGRALNGEPKYPPALPYVLRMQLFSSLSLVERRNFVFGLMNLSAGPDEIVKRLALRGVDGALVDRIKHLLPGGFAPALTEADKRRLEQKGAWHEVTGETWGSKKAPTWVAAAPEYNAQELAEAVQEVQGWNDEVGRLNQLVGQLTAHNRAVAQIPALREQARGHASHTADVNKHQREYNRLVEALEALPAPGAPAKVKQGQLLPPTAAAGFPRQICPCCQADLMVNDNGAILVFRAPPVVVPDPPKVERTLDTEQAEADARARASRRSQLETDKSQAARLLAAAQGRVEEADRAVSMITELEKKTVPEDVTGAPVALETAKSNLTQWQAVESQQKELQRQATEAAGKTRRAAEVHAQVMRWDALANALSPDGIPSEILRDALGPIAAQLKDASDRTGLPLVELGSDMSITYGGFPYGMLSRSFQWRCDMMLVVAIAILSGLRLALLDDLDTVVGDDRGAVMGWLYDLCQEGLLEQALLFCAVSDQSKVPEMPEGSAAFWIGEAA